MEKEIEQPTVRKRTPRRISLRATIATVIATVLIGSILLYKIISYDPSFTTLTPNTIIAIDSFLHSNSSYVGMQVMSMDLSRNTKHTVYVHLESNEIQKLYMNYITNRVSQITPIFTTNNDANNARMIKIINHEFVCSPFVDSMLYRNLPTMGGYISTICVVSIPPSYGHFLGSVHLFLDKPPDEIQTSIIKLHLKEISSNIFEEMH